MKKRIIYWTDRHEAAVKGAHESLIKQGIRLERGGEPNVSAIILHLLEQEARKAGK